MHQILSVAELIDITFTYADRPTLAAAARTTKTWTEPALDRLWADLPSLLPLVRLLGNIRLVTTSDESEDSDEEEANSRTEWVLSRTLPQNWARLLIMGKRVKSLRYSDELVEGKRPTAMAAKVFDQLAYQRTGDFLPHLRSLEWHASNMETIGYLVLFLSPSLRLIDIQISDSMAWAVSSSEMKHVLAFFGARCPLLEGMNLRLPFPAQYIHESLVEVFGGIKSLKSVSLPPFYLSEGIVQSLGKLPNLEYLGQISDCAPHPTITIPPAHIPLICPNWFQRLKVLVFDASMREAADFLRNPNRPRLLETWGITTYRREVTTSAVMDEVLNLVAIHYPNIRHLFITILHHYYLPSLPLSYDNISLLLPCRKLEGLNISCNHPIWLTQDQITRMGDSWPNIASLSLSSHPINISMQGIPLDLLSAILSNFHNLESLSLYLDSSTLPSFVPLSPSVPSRLKKLDLGLSPIAREHTFQTAVFLSDLLTAGVEITFGGLEMFKDGLYDVPFGFNTECKGRRQHWKEVDQTMKVLAAYKIHTEARHQAELKSSHERTLEPECWFVKT